ncbi:MAG: type I restriction endonuclease subunit R [Planctomycetota bacterium]
MSPMNEDTLVQQTTADYLAEQLNWQSVYAYNTETFGPDSLLGRASEKEVVLTRHLREKLVAFNPGLPEAAYDQAIRGVVDYSSSQSSLQTNREKHVLITDGVPVQYRDDDGQLVRKRLKLIDFNNPDNNHFLVVRELWIKGDLYRRRADLVGFVNGLPLLFIECKNIHKNLRSAFERNIKDYKDTIPHAFHHNAMIMLANGEKAKIGSVSSNYGHFHDWKRLAEDSPGVVDMETLLKGVCDRRTFLELVESFIVFDESASGLVKIVARNHQYLGVNRAVEAVQNREARAGKLGVFWHTQGSGKSYSMVFFTRRIHRKLGANYTFLICTDRDDLDTQIYRTFAGCGLADNDRDPCRARSGAHLKELLGQHKSFVFTLIQKFNQPIDEKNPDEWYSSRDDVIVISDEAHRSQYGDLALNMRNALPNAGYIGFTGTPLFKEDEITRRVFGDYVSTYDFQRAVEDGATVPLYYDARGERLGLATDDLNEKIAAKLEELESDDVDVSQRLERELRRDYHVITADKRLTQIAEDFVLHYSKAWESGKAMLVCIDKVTCVRMHEMIKGRWARRVAELEAEMTRVDDEQEIADRQRQIEWMKQTEIAVVISEEQGEVEKFARWDLDIRPHRRLIKDGFELEDGKRIDVESAFKKSDHPFRVSIVCAMWLTGFDVPSLSTLYLDKPLKAHTLMQAIARANRVHEGKNNGLIIDYCGILKNLRKALATFAGHGDGGRGGDGEQDPTRPDEELLEALDEAIGLVRSFLSDRGAPLEEILQQNGFARNAAIVAAKEAANENDASRKRFELMCRQVFRLFRSCINVDGVSERRSARDATNIIYKSLQQDRENADISEIIRELHRIVDEAVKPNETDDDAGHLYDISKIDFDRLRQEFSRTPAPRTTVQNLRQAVEVRLQRLLNQNPLRTDFQKHYEEIVAAYNQEKDRQTIEQTFEALLALVSQLDEEQSRAVREGLKSEEYLAIYDLLFKPELTSTEIKQIKSVAVGLLEMLKAEKLKIDKWRDKEATRDAVRQSIRDYLYADTTGLPVDHYSEDEVYSRAEQVFQHVYRVYPNLPSPVYSGAA